MDDQTPKLLSVHDIDLLRRMLDGIEQPTFVKDEGSRFVTLNQSMCQFMGKPYEVLSGRSDAMFVRPEQASGFRANDLKVLETGQDHVTEEVISGSFGEPRTIVTQKKRVCLENGQCFVVGTISDISELKQREASSNLMFDSNPLPMWIYSIKEFKFLAVNDAAIDHYRYSRERFSEMSVLDITPADEVEALIAASNNESSGTERVWTHIRADGSLIQIAAYCQFVQFEGQPSWMVAIVDVTDQKRVAERIAHLAHHDALTDLPNRTAFSQRLAEMLERARATSETFAVLCLDLDRFKDVNDIFGHAAGDALLREIAKRLSAAAGNAFLARMGGDEFTMIVGGPQPEGAISTVDRLMETVIEDFEFEGQRFRVGLSVGMAFFPSDGADAETLLGNADAALYRAKADGRGVSRMFEAVSDRRLRNRRLLQQELLGAVARQELSLDYQPQALLTGEIVGFEALVRWHHPQHGLISPAAFIPLAEESGQIVPIGEWILHEACREAASWPNPVQIAVNLSPIQFRHGDLPSVVHEILIKTGLAPTRLELEITEGVLIDNFSRATSILRRLKALGVKIAMDDFGTGYSSLSYLQSFPFDKIKIDQSFTANISKNPQSAAIIRAIVGLGRGLSMSVIAEGVETSDQLDFLRDEACGEVQGYFVGRPSPIANYAQEVGRPIPVKSKRRRG